MKKLLSIATALALIVSMACISVYAHGGHHGAGRCRNQSSVVYHCEKDCTFSDKDGDGICDNCGSKGYYCKDGCFFVDEDNDGICDNCDSKGVCSAKPASSTSRRGHCHN